MNVALPKIRIVPLDELTLSPSNPRLDVGDDYIAALAGSLVEIGLIQSLAGVEVDGRVEIVAGGCRLRALRIAVASRPDLDTVPVMIAPDAETAKVWSAVENDLRRALKPGAIIRAARNAKARGDDVTTMARIFGTTDAEVRRALALAALPDEAITALDEDRLSWDQAKALTAAPTPERMAEALEAALAGESAWKIRETFRGPIAANDRRVRLVGLEELEAAGAMIHRDLFDDRVTVTGEDIVDRLFKAELDEAKDELRGEGWKWAIVDLEATSAYGLRDDFIKLPTDIDLMTPEQRAEYEALDKINSWDRDEAEKERFAQLEDLADGDHSPEARALSGAVIFFDYHGHLKTVTGLLQADDIEEAVATGRIEQPTEQLASSTTSQNDDQPDAGPMLSAALKSDLDNLRGVALGVAISTKTELALDLYAMQLSGKLRYAPIFAEGHDTGAMVPDLDGLTIADDWMNRPSAIDHKDATAQILADFLGEGKKARNAVLALRLGQRVKANAGGRALMTDLEHLADSSIRDVWTPTVANFLKRVNGAYLDALHTELLGHNDEERQKTFAKLKKGEKDTHMSDIFGDPAKDDLIGIDAATRKRIDAWTPDLTA